MISKQNYIYDFYFEFLLNFCDIDDIIILKNQSSDTYIFLVFHKIYNITIKFICENNNIYYNNKDTLFYYKYSINNTDININYLLLNCVNDMTN